MSAPAQPSTAYLVSLVARTEALTASTDPVTSAHTGAPPELLGAAGAAVDSVAEQVVALSQDLHAHPEEGFAEHRSVAAVAALLSEHGIPSETGVHGLATALQAEVGSGDGPCVAVLAELDALPGLGHACGHNIICTAAVGAFLALAATVTTGRVRLLVTPAEEGGGGKELMAREGAFDGVDAAVMLHPFSHDIAAHPFLGRRQLAVTCTGVAAHASAQPFMGRNALDAIVAGYTGVAALRQHIPDPDRVHGIITDGGQRPNVVPATASALYYVRSAEPETLADLAQRVEQVVRAGAQMHGCGIELTWDPQPGTLPIRHNAALAARYATHLAGRGRTVLPRGVVPESLTGSTDLGNVSVRVPSIHPMIAISGPQVALHTAEFAAAAASPAGDAAVIDGAIGLAATVLDFLHDSQLRADVAAEFAAAGGPMDVPRYFA